MDLKNMTHNEKIDLAFNPDTPDDTLRELATDKNDRVRRGVATNTNTPEDILGDLAKDVNYGVRRRVAINRHTPEDTLRDFAMGTSSSIRYHVAENPKSSIKILCIILDFEKSLKKPKIQVIRALYGNPKLPHIARIIIETLFGRI